MLWRALLPLDGLFKTVGCQHVGGLQEGNQRAFFHCRAIGTTGTTALLCHFKHSHVPTDGQKFLLAQTDEPTEDEA